MKSSQIFWKIKFGSIFLTSVVLTVFLFVQPVMAGTETRITDDAFGQMFPDIDGNRIVWQDNRNGNWDIYMYDVSTHIETQITSDIKDQRLPKISGDRIVWQDSRHSPDEVYIYDISTQTESRLSPTTQGKYNPHIDGNVVVWEDGRHGYTEIYAYNLSTNIEKRITNAAWYQNGPRVSGDKVVWQDNRCGFICKPDIYMYDLTTETETQITSNEAAQSAPDISENRVVWTDRRHNNTFDIYQYDLMTQTESRITTDISYDQITPKISGHRATWTDYGINPGIYVYDLISETAARVSSPGAEYSEISGNKLVWMEQRNVNFDIYMYDLNPNVNPAAQISPVPVTIFGQAISFDGSGSSDSDGTIANYHWDFGDGATGDGANVNHTYVSAGAYNVTLTVTDDDGATGTAMTSVLVNAPPVAAIFPVATITLGQATVFDGSASSDPDGIIATYNWDFGDGSIGNGITTNHVYTAPGTYQVALTVTDNNSALATATTTARVNAPPVVHIAPTQAVVVGEATILNGSGSSDSDGVVVTYAWDFGDGSAGSGATASHVYAAAGTYQVILTVIDNDGAMGAVTTTVIVQTATQAVDSLTDLVQVMNLAQGITNSLDAKLQNASDALNAMNSGSASSAINKLQAFINAVQAQSGNQLTVEQADQLIDTANRIIAAI